MMRFVAMIATLLLPTVALCAEPSLTPPRVGDSFEIRMEYEIQERAGDESSGSSSGHSTVIEQVVGIRDDGWELEYDLSNAATAQDRARTWQFPVRVFRPLCGPAQLLNRAELEARISDWLKLAKMTRDACGKWIFTWNAFKIECDPQSAITSLEPFNLWGADLREGAPYQEADASGSGTLARKVAGSDSVIFAVEMPVDPEAVRRARAESDVVVGEIMKQPVTLDAALRARAKEAVSGTISVTFDTDSAGNVRRRKKVTKLQIKGADGKEETQTRTERVDRKLVSRVNP